MIIGVDIGGTAIKLGLFSMKGELLDKWSINTDTGDDGKNVLPSVATAIINRLNEKKLSYKEILAIGIGVPCPITRDGDIVKSANLGWKKSKNVKKELAYALGTDFSCGIYTGNDANVAALGEAFMGAAAGRENVVMVTLGTGVGGGIISGGSLIYGAHGMGGEIGHMHINDSETKTCGCGSKGCLEQMSSATGIVRLAKNLLEEYKEPSILRKQSISAKAVFDAYKENDFIARLVVDRFAKYLARALVNVSMIVDPDIFVIGGGVSAAGDCLLEPIKKYYKEFMSFSLCDHNEFVLATLGNDAGIVGAAKLAIDGIKGEATL